LEAFGRADFAPLTITEAAFLLGFGISTPSLPPLFNFDKTKKALRGPVYGRAHRDLTRPAPMHAYADA
jgi:hypothetical protein